MWAYLWSKKWWILTLAVVVGGGIWWWRAQSAVVVPSTATVTRKDISRTVSVTGKLSGESRVNINFEAQGRVSQILKRTGDTVIAGETIAKLDTSVVAEDVARAQAALDLARAAAGGNVDVIREAKVAVENAKQTEDETDDAQDQSVYTAEKNYNNAKDYETAAQDYYDEVVNVSGSGSVAAKSAKLQYVQAQNATELAKLQWDSAKKARDLAQSQTHGITTSAKARLQTAESQFTRAQNSAQVAQAQNTYDSAVANMDKYTLRAPVTGVLGRVTGRVGDLTTAFATAAFASIATSDYLVEAEVPEADIATLATGQLAEVRFDAADDLVVPAKVVSIDQSPLANASDVVYYVVRLRADSSVDKRLKEGMSADVDIALASRSNVLFIPFRAIKKKDGKEYVNLWTGTESKEKEIATGLESLDGDVEVLSGLSENDQVVVPDQTLLK